MILATTIPFVMAKMTICTTPARWMTCCIHSSRAKSVAYFKTVTPNARTTNVSQAIQSNPAFSIINFSKEGGIYCE